MPEKIVAKDFDAQKKACLSNLYMPDKSRKGEIDKAIFTLVEYINSLKDYYTTSSCSGRIMLLTQAEKKPDVKWLYVTHEQATVEDVLNALSSESLKSHPEMVWFRQENLILHVACRTIDDANKLLKIARDIGLRRSGIIADSNNIIVEICSTEKMDVPVALHEQLIVSKDYIRTICCVANEKFLRGREKLERLEKDVKSNLR